MKRKKYFIAVGQVGQILQYNLASDWTLSVE